MLFTDYYAEASCTGRPRQLHHRAATDPYRHDDGRPGGCQDWAAGGGLHHRHGAQGPGYATGQFGKKPPGGSQRVLPTVHGFDEFFGYLYHLDAMEDPAHPNYPQDLLNVVGPRNMVHSWATETDDQSEMPRWARSANRRFRAGTLYPKRMETVDDEIRDFAINFMDKAKKGEQTVLRLAQPDPHAHRHAPLPEVAGDRATRRTAGPRKKPACPAR